MQPSVLKLEYQFSGRRFFDVCEASALRTALEWFGECQELISGEGASSPLSPRRLRAKYTLRTNLRFMLRGFRPAGGKFAQAQIYSPKEPDCIYSCRPKRQGAWMLLLLTATLWSKYAATSTGLRKSPLRLSEIDSREPPGNGHRFAISRHRAAAHKESGGISLSAKGKEKGICEKKFIYRNGKTA